MKFVSMTAPPTSSWHGLRTAKPQRHQPEQLQVGMVCAVRWPQPANYMLDGVRYGFDPVSDALSRRPTRNTSTAM